MDGITPSVALLKLASENNLDILKVKFAKFMDENDELKDFIDQFIIPKNITLKKVDLELCDRNDHCLYFCGHSLGLEPKRTKVYLEKVLNDWGEKGVEMHFHGFQPAAFCEDYVKPLLAKFTGSKESEVCAMNGLTVNLNLVTLSFYKPTKQRWKILMEHASFPSDRYAMRFLLHFHGYNPDEGLIQMKPRDGEHCLRNEDIIELIDRRGHEIAMIMFAGVQYYTGQLFDMKEITEAGHKQGCIVGFDLAHALGNVRLNLHDWNVDFAMWCTYKYLCSGPGGLAGIFIHENCFDTKPTLAGWWGNKMETRFSMLEDIDLANGPDAFKLSNCSPFLTSMLQASLEVYDEAGIDRLLHKQFYLTGYLEFLLRHHINRLKFQENRIPDGFVQIITPADHTKRGTQISLLFSSSAVKIVEEISKRGVVVDFRRPHVVRLGPVPIYTSFQSVHKLVSILISVFEEHQE